MVQPLQDNFQLEEDTNEEHQVHKARPESPGSLECIAPKNLDGFGTKRFGKLPHIKKKMKFKSTSSSFQSTKSHQFHEIRDILGDI